MLLLFLMVLLAGCGPAIPANGTATGGVAAGTAAAATGMVTLTLTDPTTGLAVSNITIGRPVHVNAVVKDSAGVVVTSAVVTFATNTAIGSITPVSATALTDATGLAVVNLDGVTAGADTLTATVQVGGTTLTSTIAYSVGAAVFTMPNPMTFLVNPLSAYGSTTVGVDLFSGGALVTTPVPVTFSSVCALAGKATISSPVTTSAGTATATYTDNGCGTTDTITASVGGASLSGVLNVVPPTAGSIQFVSAVPTQIALKGAGGTGLQGTSIVIFKVLDSMGNPLSAKLVNFSLSTTVGGITLYQASSVTDALGQVTVSVLSGSVSTPVRVIASTTASVTTLNTSSDMLTITTGLPDQDSFTLSAPTLNIEGWSRTGASTQVSVLLSDHFNNPVPDGTAVNFTTEGGQIAASCVTVSGGCSVSLVSANPRPADGRVTVLAYAVGNESFTDLNGNGLADNIGEMIDINGVRTDMTEVYTDYNENGLRNLTEPFIDFNGDGVFNAPDGKYSGVLCNPAAGLFCAANRNIHVGKAIVIVISSSTATITPPVAAADLGGNSVATQCNVPTTATFRITDIHGNAMPAGSTISFATTNGTITTASSFVVPNTSANVLSSPATFDYTVGLASDATYTAVVAGPPVVPASCADATPGGLLSVTVTTPSGVVTTSSVMVTN